MKHKSLLCMLMLVTTCSDSLPAPAAPPAPVRKAKVEAEKSRLAQAKTLFENGKYKEAAVLLELEITRARNSGQHQQAAFVDALIALARAQAALGDIQSAGQTLEKAAAIATAYALQPAVLMNIEAEKGSLKTPSAAGLTNIFRSSSYGSRSIEIQDPAEEEYMRKAAIDYSKRRAGSASAIYLARQLEYLKFLAKNQRLDDVMTCAQSIATTYSTLAETTREVVLPLLIESAQQMADNNFATAADILANNTIGELSTRQTRNAAELASKLGALANSFEQRRNNDLAQKYYLASVNILEKQNKKDDLTLAKLRASLASFYRKNGKEAAANELLEMAFDAHSVTVAPVSAQTIDTLSALTNSYAAGGQHDKTKASTEKLVLALNNRDADARIPFAQIMNTAALIASAGDCATARKLYLAAFKCLKTPQRNNVSDYEVQKEVKNLAYAFTHSGNVDECDYLLDNLITARMNSSNQPTAASLNACIDAAQFYIEQENFDKADKAAERAFEQASQVPSGRERLGSLARQLQDKKRYPIALKLTQAALSDTDKSSSSQIIDLKSRLAALQHFNGQETEARATMKEAAKETCASLPSTLSEARPVLEAIIEKLITSENYRSVNEVVANLAHASSYQYKGDIISRIASIILPLDMPEQTDRLFALALQYQSGSHGPSSVQAASVMRSYAQFLSTIGKGQQAQELQRADRAIQLLYQKQAYKPFASLAETIAAAEGNNDTDFSMHSLRVPR